MRIHPVVLTINDEPTIDFPVYAAASFKMMVVSREGTPSPRWMDWDTIIALYVDRLPIAIPEQNILYNVIGEALCSAQWYYVRPRRNWLQKDISFNTGHVYKPGWYNTYDSPVIFKIPIKGRSWQHNQINGYITAALGNDRSEVLNLVRPRKYDPRFH